jgi:hypothetical protein
MAAPRLACLAATVFGALSPVAAIAGGGAGYGPPGPPYAPPPYFDEPPTIRAAAAACRADIERYCVGVLPGRGRIISCLAGNRDRLSPTCEDVLRRAEFFFGR